MTVLGNFHLSVAVDIGASRMEEEQLREQLRVANLYLQEKLLEPHSNLETLELHEKVTPTTSS